MPVDIDPSDSIEHMIHKFKEERGLHSDENQLLLDGRELRGEQADPRSQASRQTLNVKQAGRPQISSKQVDVKSQASRQTSNLKECKQTPNLKLASRQTPNLKQAGRPQISSKQADPKSQASKQADPKQAGRPQISSKQADPKTQASRQTPNLKQSWQTPN